MGSSRDRVGMDVIELIVPHENRSRPRSFEPSIALARSRFRAPFDEAIERTVVTLQVGRRLQGPTPMTLQVGRR